MIKRKMIQWKMMDKVMQKKNEQVVVTVVTGNTNRHRDQ